MSFQSSSNLTRRSTATALKPGALTLCVRRHHPRAVTLPNLRAFRFCFCASTVVRFSSRRRIESTNPASPRPVSRGPRAFRSLNHPSVFINPCRHHRLVSCRRNPDAAGPSAERGPALNRWAAKVAASGPRAAIRWLLCQKIPQSRRCSRPMPVQRPGQTPSWPLRPAVTVRGQVVLPHVIQGRSSI